MRRRSHLLLLPTVAAALALAAGPLAATGETDAWSRVAAARRELTAASPLTTTFVQSYTPSGFSVADEESGQLAMRLGEESDEDAECVRWDYDEPFPKGFLLCGHIAWAWNPGEESGRRQLVGRADGFGLDLLRLSVEELKASYEASTRTMGTGGDDRLQVELVPTGAAANEIRDAQLELDPATGRLLALSYHDVEGNLTRFSLGDFSPVADPATLFAPPAGLDWLDE